MLNALREVDTVSCLCVKSLAECEQGGGVRRKVDDLHQLAAMAACSTRMACTAGSRNAGGSVCAILSSRLHDRVRAVPDIITRRTKTQQLAVVRRGDHGFW